MATDPYARFTRLVLQHEPQILRAVMVFVPSGWKRDIVQKTADDGRADDKEKRDAALRECLDAMPQNSREIIEGHYYFERSIEVRASTHDRSVAAIDKTPPPLRAGLLDCFIKISMPNVKWMAL